MKRRGFSIVELAITVAVIGILSLIAVASLRHTQVAARDDERRVKAESIANALELLYKSGDSTKGTQPGAYPSKTAIDQAVTDKSIASWLPGIDSSTLKFSWLPKDAPVNIKTLPVSSTYSNNDTERDTYYQAHTAINEIVYEPLSYSNFSMGGDNDRWSFCNSGNDCRRFNIYYRLEADNTVQIIRSNVQ